MDNNYEYTKYNYWQIYLNGVWEDTVSYCETMSEDEVKHSLINHDGYDIDIELRLEQ